MASSVLMNEKHKEAIEELKAELGEVAYSAPQGVMLCSGLVSMASGTDTKSQATTRALMLNNGIGTITLQEKIDWSGKPLGSYPPSILVDRSGKATHRGVPPEDSNGSMGAVVYVGPNVQGGSIDCAWVLAWSVPGNGSQKNKIYVETGPSTKYPKGNVKWDKIKLALEGSIEKSYAKPDEITGAEASAEIDENGNTPAAAVVFSVTPL